jgi:circadian clock protein KaiC
MAGGFMMVLLEKVKTGIPGVDEMLEGGLPVNSVTVVSGPPGIGKSNFAMQFIYKGIQEYDEPGVFLTVEDKPEVVRNYATTFGWDMKEYEEAGKLVVLSQSGYGSTSDQTIGDAIRNVGAKRFVLDSLTLFRYLFKDDISQRVNLLNFITEIKKAGCTSLLTAEQRGVGQDIMYSDEHFLSDGLIQLFWSRHRERNERCFRVVKMRGSRINSDIRPMDITDKGVVVYPTQVPLSLAEE